MKAGGAVADLNDYPVAAYIAKTAGGGNDFEVVGEQIDAGPFGIAVDKENTQLRDALKEALDAIIKDGDVQEGPGEVGRQGRRRHRGRPINAGKCTWRSRLTRSLKGSHCD